MIGFDKKKNDLQGNNSKIALNLIDIDCYEPKTLNLKYENEEIKYDTKNMQFNNKNKIISFDIIEELKK